MNLTLLGCFGVVGVVARVYVPFQRNNAATPLGTIAVYMIACHTYWSRFTAVVPSVNGSFVCRFDLRFTAVVLAYVCNYEPGVTNVARARSGIRTCMLQQIHDSLKLLLALAAMMLLDCCSELYIFNFPQGVYSPKSGLTSPAISMFL